MPFKQLLDAAATIDQPKSQSNILGGIPTPSAPSPVSAEPVLELSKLPPNITTATRKRAADAMDQYSDDSSFRIESRNRRRGLGQGVFSKLTLKVVQHPERARVSGISTSDRRPLHPSPIVKLSGCGSGEAMNLVVFVSLWSTNLQHDLTFTSKSLNEVPLAYIPLDVNDENSTTKYRVVPTAAFSRSQIIMGQLISVSQTLDDLDNVTGQFYLFPELSVRSSGKFRLRFDLFDLSSLPHGQKPLASTHSNIFTVYNPKEFPGITETTELSRLFAKQGMKIRLRHATYDSSKSNEEDD
ncbi:velvet factor-domain-containing protein [Obelidium mucronatum]|nr:velvet factor-domain-containing protein [Obelidium mucronatum]